MTDYFDPSELALTTRIVAGVLLLIGLLSVNCYACRVHNLEACKEILERGSPVAKDAASRVTGTCGRIGTQ